MSRSIESPRKILIVGKGGREHALGYKLEKTRLGKRQIFFAPGNAGTAEIGENVRINETDTGGLISFVKENAIDQCVVGPEGPLMEGIVDAFQEEELDIFGPTTYAAEIEGNKIFATKFMQRHRIPHPRSFIFGSPQEAAEFIRSDQYPRQGLVVKYPYLASGKGVIVTDSRREAIYAVDQIYDGKYGVTREILLQEKISGPEVSVIALTDGTHVVQLPAAQDHKRLRDFDQGPNTGGMGAYAPYWLSEEMRETIQREILQPTVDGMRAENRKFQGALYAGLMLTKKGSTIQPMVLEFNARFGDPETQALMMLIEGDFARILQACIGGHLNKVKIPIRSGSAVCVVLASEGYPEKPKTGEIISGLGILTDPNVQIFHAGTRINGQRQVETSGGRVLGVTGYGRNIFAAQTRVYDVVKQIDFKGKQFRRDIAGEALRES